MATNALQFWAIFASILGVLVALVVMLLKFGRDTITKEDLRAAKEDLRLSLNNSIEAFRLEISKKFDEVDRRFDEVDRRLDEAASERREIKEEAAADRQEIKGEIVRLNQNYIDHLTHHNKE